MLLFPNAKINLGLHIINKREDGFHNLETVMLPVPWTDILEIVPNDDNTIHFKSTGLDVPGRLEDNFIVRAYHALKQAYGIGGVSVHLHKTIPIGGGLGGGSSDVAFFVKGINELFELQLDNEVMQKLVLPYGSDCPFFIANTPQLATGIGTTLQPISIDLSGYWVLLVAPNVHVATAQAYAKVKPQVSAVDLKKALNQPLASWQGHVKNDFETSVFPQFPEVEQVKITLTNAGAIYTSMSGSGATCYGVFKEKPTITFPENYPSFIAQL